MQHKRLEHIPGVTFRHVAQLRKINIHTTQQLLDVCMTAQQRETLGKVLEVSELRVFDWVCAIDLFRINGLNSTYVALLLEAGVNSAEKVAVQDPAQLLIQLRELNRERRIVRRLPSEKQIGKWVASAKEMSPLIALDSAD
ncbi:MAG: DUF4332 domain-containing protein [Candidatus Promineifilaceae bacterium]